MPTNVPCLIRKCPAAYQKCPAVIQQVSRTSPWQALLAIAYPSPPNAKAARACARDTHSGQSRRHALSSDLQGGATPFHLVSCRRAVTAWQRNTQ